MLDSRSIWCETYGMALFQKNTPDSGESQPLYSLGLQKTLIIVGLGNVGKEYEGTRHNIGFTVVDSLAKRYNFPGWVEKKDLRCLFTTQPVGDARVVLIKPTTLMNNSGQALQAVMHFYKVPLSQVVVVHDELDIPFGQIRLRNGGSDAGNNGVKSLIHHVGEEFGRIRVGVQNKTSQKTDSKDFVLGKFNKDEQVHIPGLLRETDAILSEYIHGAPLGHDTRSFIV